MPEYQYVAINAAGKKIRGSISASNQTDFNDALRAKNEFCLSFREIESVRQGVAKSRSLKLKELAVFFRQLATMLRSGITIVNSLEIISKQTSDKTAQTAILNIFGHVQEGKGLAESMKILGGTFPNFAINMIQSGEISGSLDSVVEKLAEYYEKELKTRNKIIQAMTYPIVLLLLTVTVVTVLLTFVLPSLLSQFTTTDTQLPITTTILLAISNFIKTKWYLIILFIALVSVASNFLLSARKIRIKFDRFKFSIPIFGKLYNTVVCAKFCRCLYALFSGGTSLITSIEMAARVVGNTYVEEELLQAKDEVSKGKTLSESLKETGIFPQMMLSLFNIGEQSGSLDGMILRTANIYDEESDSAITKMVSLLEPIMIIIMAVLVGFIVISIVQPMYGVFQTF